MLFGNILFGHLKGIFYATCGHGKMVDGMLSIGSSPSSKNLTYVKWNLAQVNGLIFPFILFFLSF